jgi:hypothetical protein
MSLKEAMGEPDVTHIGAIDFDTEDGAERARTVAAFLSDHHIPSLRVDSRRGAHLWITFDPQQGSVVRRALRQALALTDTNDPKVEVFPKQSGKAWGVGALRMPLMRHPKTGVTYPAYGPLGDPLVTLRDVLLAFQQTTVEALRAVAGPGGSLTPIPAPDDSYRAHRASSGNEPSVSSLLAMLGVTALPGRSVRCPFHDDRHASLSVADDDRRVWCKAPECPLHNDGKGIGSINLEVLIRKEPLGGSRVPPDAGRISGDVR